MSAISESATCATTSSWRSVRNARSPRWPLTEGMSSFLSTGTTSAFEACSAGARPKRMPVRIARPAVKASTRGSSESAARSTGKGSGSRAATIALSVHEARPIPAIPPRIERIRLSVSS